MWTKLENAGIDYIRLTSNDPKVIAEMLEASIVIMKKEVQAGFAWKPGGMIGFYGHSTRHCFFGHRGDWAMLQVTGYVAREQIACYQHIKAHCTRLDLQVTYQAAVNPALMITEAEDQSINARPRDGRKWKTKLITEDRVAETLYIGSRSSEWFGRVYDKFKESHSEQYRGCVRYEVEIKGDASRSVWEQFVTHELGFRDLYAIVHQWYDAHGIKLPESEYWQHNFQAEKKEISDDNRRLGWIAQQVSGAFKKLVDAGLLRAALAALESKLVDEQKCLLLNLDVGIW